MMQGHPDRALAVADCFGWNLRQIRSRKNLSQEQLAVRASLHRTEIGKLENAERVCRIDTLIQLAGGMAIAPEELLSGIAWVPGGKLSGAFTVGIVMSPPRPPKEEGEDEQAG